VLPFGTFALARGFFAFTFAFAAASRAAFFSARAAASAFRVGHSGLMQSVQGGRPASIAVTIGAPHSGHGGWSLSSLPRCGSG
jgi:hypothetical protein